MSVREIRPSRTGVRHQEASFSSVRGNMRKVVMDKVQVLGSIESCGIMPAVRVRNEDQALRALAALYEGGIQVAEIAMSMAGAAKILDAAIDRFGDAMVIGAGTVLDVQTARHCILAGAKFIVSPAVNLGMIELCRRYDIAVFPGAMTPTEILSAWTAGADCVKVFPAGSMGGPSYIRAVKAPLPQVKLMPMGGVSLESVAEFIKAGSFALGVGNDLVSFSSAGESENGQITRRAEAYRSSIDNARENMST
jgi:2-dehydro-3-deoxyphosphogluconate aldolase/(4S)-4-hydroxy-2-oxoglutarate aldolase